jgi:hypothetical protein
MQARIKLTVAAALTALIAACAPSADMGADQATRSEASSVTWSDGQQAVAIKCDQPGGCQERALAICKGGAFKVLKSENMPTTGTQREVQRPPSVVIRCG